MADAATWAKSYDWNFGIRSSVQRPTGIGGDTRRQRVHQLPRIFKLSSALNADLVRPLVDGEHAAQLAVTTYKGKPENQ